MRVDTSDPFGEGSGRGHVTWLAEWLGGGTDGLGELDVGEALMSGSRSRVAPTSGLWHPEQISAGSIVSTVGVVRVQGRFFCERDVSEGCVGGDSEGGWRSARSGL